jgi:hypothetical protein
LTPVLGLTLGGGLNWNERIEAKLSVTIPEIETSLSGFQVDWTTEGGEVKSMEEVTNSEGIAILNIIANDKETVTVSATVSGNGLESATAEKTAQIKNMPLVTEKPEVETIEETSPFEGLEIDATILALIAIPIIIVAAIIFLKRTDRLDLITEKIPVDGIGDSIEGIKEKISDIKDR